MAGHRVVESSRPSYVQVALSLNQAVKRLGGARCLLGRGRVHEADLILAQLHNWLVDLRNEVKDDDSSWSAWRDESGPARRLLEPEQRPDDA